MNENSNDEIAMFHKRKRRRHRMLLTTFTIGFILIAIMLIFSYYVLTKKSYINYNETSNLKYGINIIENEFYKTNYLEGNVDVISSLIKDIDVEFKYNLNLSEEIEYNYNYEIIANIGVKKKDKTNLIYNDEQVVVKKEKQEGKSKRLEIIEPVKVSYNDYNSQIKKLIEEYKLDNTVSELSLTMVLNITNKATGERINKESKVMTINIPLDVKTVEITINENIKNNEGKIVIQENENVNSNKYLILGILVLAIGLLTLLSLIRYNSKTRSAEKMYEDEMKKILFDYKSYIQKINTKINYKSYKIIRVDSFSELIGMREEIQAPILMYTEKNNLKTIFMMIKDDMLFTYILSAKAIRTKLIKKKSLQMEGKEKNEKNK